MLPEGFEWREFVDGPALYVGGRQVAICSGIPSGCRVDFMLHRRSEFFDGVEPAQRYCEAWARKWEARIRHEVELTVVRAWGSVRKP